MPRTRRIAGLAALALLASPLAGRAAEVPTSHGRVSQILRENCRECHRPGQVAPFALLDYEQARKRADDIAQVTGERAMPPWHASTTVGGPFRDARVLSNADIATLANWADAGAPEGERPADEPAVDVDGDWPLGTPDLVLKPTEAFELSAAGRDEFRVFVLPTGLAEGKWIRAVDFRPGNAKVVHHILAAFDASGQARALDEADPKPGYSSFAGFGILPGGGLSGWAPGKAPRNLPDGVGRYLPTKTDVLLQIHYHKSGKPERDATSIGLYFADKPIDKLLRGGVVAPPRARGSFRPTLAIKAGDPNYEIRGSWTAPYEAHLTAVIPHMHWRGKDFRLDATRPDGSTVPLLVVDRWDFNWQDTYEFASAVAIPAGTRVDMLAHFDNSADNPANPTVPPVDVRWGEQTNDEMCLGFLQLTRDDEHLDGRPPGRFAAEAARDPRAAKAEAERTRNVGTLLQIIERARRLRDR